MNYDSPISLVAATALAEYRLVYINSSGQAAYATANIKPFGVTQKAVAEGEYVPVVPLNGAAILRVSVSGAAAVGADVYSTASGRASTTAAGFKVGTVTKAGYAADDFASVSVSASSALVKYYNVTQAATLTLTADDSGAYITNVGATGTSTISLPAAPPQGVYFKVYIRAAYAVNVDPGASDKIIGLAALAPSDGEYVTADAAHEYLELLSNSSGDWEVVGYGGTWAEQTP